jgi:hypothetical protein
MYPPKFIIEKLKAAAKIVVDGFDEFHQSADANLDISAAAQHIELLWDDGDKHWFVTIPGKNLIQAKLDGHRMTVMAEWTMYVGEDDDNEIEAMKEVTISLYDMTPLNF